MVARGQLRDDPAIGFMHGDLGMDGVGQQPPAVKGDSGLVAGGLDAED